MTPERWQQIEAICARAFEVPQEERERFLDRACDGDDSLQSEVRSLLAADDEAGSFIAEGVLGARPDHSSHEGAEGRRIGPYRLLHKLGEGGMSVVYLAARIDG